MIKKLEIGSMFLLAFISGCTSFFPAENTNDNNNTLETATSYTIGDTAHFAFEENNDIEYYKLHCNKAGLYIVTIMDIVKKLPLFIEVLGREDEKVIKEIIYDYNSSTYSFGCQLRGTEDFYIKLNTSMYENSEHKMKFVIVPDSIDTFEINRDIASAASIDIDTYYHAKIYPKGDNDYYKFTIRENGIYSFKIDSVSRAISLQFQVLSFENVSLFWTGGYTISADNPLDSAFMLKAGVYYMKAFAGSDASSYLQPYRFRISKDTTDKFEWNNDTASAKEIDLNTTTKGKIFPAGDRDYFKFNIASDDTVIFTVDSVSQRLPHLKLYILDARFENVASGGVGVNYSIVLKSFFKKGLYYLYLDTQAFAQASNYYYYLTAH